MDFDVIIIGSGPAGAQAADQLVRSGLRVALIDIGNIDNTYEKLIPDAPFSEIRTNEKSQAKFFLGEEQSSIFAKQNQAGAHLTPARQHMIEGANELLPWDSKNFFALTATSRGGLGTSWGANCFSFSERQLKATGLPPSKVMRSYYDQVAENIGVSADKNSTLAKKIADFEPLQKPLQLDTNTSKILATYKKYESFFTQKRFVLGVSPLASLSEPMTDRRENTFRDMDFWDNHGKSVYRPRYTIESLINRPNFKYLTNRLALKFVRKDRGVEVEISNLKSSTLETISSRRLIMAAGAINSARLVAASIGAYHKHFPILCNPVEWVVGVNLKMLGKPANEKRHSLAQITGVLDAEPNNDEVIAQFYSYRSLLLFKLLKDMPMPPFLALPLLRLLSTALTLVNVQYCDYGSEGQSIVFSKVESGKTKATFHFIRDEKKIKLDRKVQRRVLWLLLRLGVFPLSIKKPVEGASIHYAGTLPISSQFQERHCDEMGRLWEAPEVFIADSSTWRFLPARGLTFTIMAGARLVADRVRMELIS